MSSPKEKLAEDNTGCYIQWLIIAAIIGGLLYFAATEKPIPPDDRPGYYAPRDDPYYDAPRGRTTGGDTY